MESEGTVFSIEEFSTFDGPGIRTTVFLKGCPLRCIWCHNPEGQSFEDQILRNPNGCIGCGKCLRAGTRGSGELRLTEESIEVCPRNLVRRCGERYTPQAFCGRLLKNEELLREGGVTFSGGEPLAQPAFLLQCLTLLRGRLNRAVQTSGYCDPNVFLTVLEQTDYMLFDLKLMDREEHLRDTGVSNDCILENFRALCRSGAAFCVRVPLIPGVTDTEENLRAIAAIMKENGARMAELLPYNRMAGGKYALAGMHYAPTFDEGQEVAVRRELFEDAGIRIKVL